MSVFLAAIAIVVVVGGIVAVSAREARVAVLGTSLTLLGAPLLADPLPGPLPLAARLVSAMLVCYLLWVGTRGATAVGRGSNLGWPVETLAGGAGFVIGWGSAGLGAPALGPPAAAAAGFALATAAVLPIAFGGDVGRLGTGLILLVTASALIRVNLGGTPVALEQLLISAVTVGLGASVAFLSAYADALAGSTEIRPRRSRPDG